MTTIQIIEQTFDSYDLEKQKQLMLDKFVKIRDKGYVYTFLCTVLEREMNEQKKTNHHLRLVK